MDTTNKLPVYTRQAASADHIREKIRRTANDRVLGGLRLLLGGLFVMTGLMKLFVPMLGEAFSGQLLAAHIPFYGFNTWFVPITEVVVGALLLLGLFSRIAGLVAISMMLVATYVHLVVDNPALFPLQPEAPVIPLAAIAIAVYVVWRGGGAGSADLRASFAAAAT
jgi:putative oxidoreductase